MQCCQCPSQTNTRTISLKTLASGRYQKKGQGSISGSSVEQGQKKRQKTICNTRTISNSLQGTGTDKRRPLCSRARTILVKKKGELGLKGPLKGHFSKEIKKTVVDAIQTAIANGLDQNKACKLMGLAPRKYRRWLNPKRTTPRIAWNKILPKERKTIIQTALHPDF